MAEKKETKNIEREYVIPLRKQVKKVPRYKKTNKAVKTIKEFLVRHMQVRDRDLKKIKIDRHLNEMLWFRGIKRPPAKVKVKAIKDDKGIVRVQAVELMENLKFKKTREEKREASVKEKKKTLVEKAKGAMKGKDIEEKRIEEHVKDKKAQEVLKEQIEEKNGEDKELKETMKEDLEIDKEEQTEVPQKKESEKDVKPKTEKKVVKSK